MQTPLVEGAKKEGIEREYLAEADLIKPSNRNDGFYDTFPRPADVSHF
jgi:DNA primase